NDGYRGQRGGGAADVPHGAPGRCHAPGRRTDDPSLGAARRLDASDAFRSRRAVRTRAAAPVARPETSTLRAFIRLGAGRTECCVIPGHSGSLLTRSPSGGIFEILGALYRLDWRDVRSANAAKEAGNAEQLFGLAAARRKEQSMA